ncbi:sigma-70 family RNA polymerase sigma factor [Streptomyces sp. RB6PN25]|uniref:Sigma-70 family RNA polymerase sigma factor n=1 Tax=Streptomyces humicola TaxID=2953240 RepID=A0ABT1PYH0_9ACTN|nr:sigma-70 family RNA polymerase sigma factor [Streptomyces humicola]MCQ4082711.1 sigma-70 family RNA polymerase sigma factor [Streptomyces humicola]
MTSRTLPARLARLGPLLAAEAAAEAGPAGADPRDLEQAVWLRLLECGGPPSESPARWLRDAVRAEARGFRRRGRREVPYDDRSPRVRAAAAVAPSAEGEVIAAETRELLRAAVRRLPGRCPQLISALLSRSDPTYHQISRELGISQGSLGPLRSRCLGCLRALLRTEVELPQLRGTQG